MWTKQIRAVTVHDMKTLLLLLIALALFPLQDAFSDSTSATNKKTVIAFYEMAFNKHMPAEAMKQFGGDTYTQHNPFVTDGKKPFIDYFIKFQKEHPTAGTEIKRVLSDGNLVSVHAHSKVEPRDLGRAVMDIFRLEHGKIIEHWDVAQPVPEKSANTNTMF